MQYRSIIEFPSNPWLLYIKLLYALDSVEYSVCRDNSFKSVEYDNSRVNSITGTKEKILTHEIACLLDLFSSHRYRIRKEDQNITKGLKTFSAFSPRAIEMENFLKGLRIQIGL